MREDSLAGLAAWLAKGGGLVHFVGVCGVGMAGLAALCRDAGFDVSGCDVAPNRLAAWLRGKGIDVAAGHDPCHIGADAGLVVRSAAVPVDAPEIRRALELGVPVFSRGEVLSHMAWPGLVAVGGTHGKTTTTAFIAQLLKGAGRDPSWCVGGEVSGCGCHGVSGSGAGGLTVLEADESDGTLALYRPDIAVVTNVEFDHMEHFASVDAFRDCFRTFVRNAGKVVYCGDDPGAVDACRARGDGRRGADGTVCYGFSDGADVGATGLVQNGLSQEFTLALHGTDCGRVTLNVPGRHNVLNALAAVAVVVELGLSPEDLVGRLAEVRLPGRRFELVVSRDGVRVISDYAHHPSEVAALTAAAGCLAPRRIQAVFQPHRYTRTLALGKDFPSSFSGVDELVLVPVYAASESPLRGGTVRDLYREFRSAGTVKNVAVAGSLRQAWEYMRRRLTAGDVLLVVGAGDVEKIAGWAKDDIADRGRMDGTVDREAALLLAEGTAGLAMRFDEPLAGKTTFGLGGTADIWTDVGSEQGLVRLLAWCSDRRIPFHVLGAGSNVLVSDLGVRGVTARLAGGAFHGIETGDTAGDAITVRAGAGVSVAALLGRLEQEGLSGLEFMEGIPGSVGGALMMNAGAAGGEICRHVSWIRCLNMDGAEHIVTRDRLQFGYRCCPSLDGLIVVEAGLTVMRGGSVEIAARRAEARERRRWMTGLRCAGSVFRNPVGAVAGRLIEGAGLKGAAVGGAVVSALHANVIVAGPGARESDVSALIEMVRAVVLDKYGIMLEKEIVEMGGEGERWR